MAYSFEFNQETSDFHKISVEARPNIPGKRRKRNIYGSRRKG